MSTRRTKFQYDDDDYYDDYYDYDDYDDYGGNSGYSKPKAKPALGSKAKTATKVKAKTKAKATPGPTPIPSSVDSKPNPTAKTKTKTKEQEILKNTVGTNSQNVSISPLPSGSTDSDQNKAETTTVTTSLKHLKLEEELELELENKNVKPLVNLVVVGHVDAGKSTLMGHLLYKLKFVSDRLMHKFEKESKEIGKSSFAFAWVMDEHEEERMRGVTVDVGVRHFETEKRRITLLDAPGHRDFIPNMISGTAQADAALMVVPASTGEFESSFQWNGQTQEHALLVRYLGVSSIIVAVNKLDAVQWNQERYEQIKNIMLDFLINKAGFKLDRIQFVPCSGLTGENLINASEPLLLNWYKGETLAQVLDALQASKRPLKKAFRMCVADIRNNGAVVSGKIEAGYVHLRDKVVVCPLGAANKNVCTVKSIHRHGGEKVNAARAGENVDIALSNIESNLLRVGSILCPPDSLVPIITDFEAQIVTLEALQVPLFPGSQLTLYTQSVQVPATITKLVSSSSTHINISDKNSSKIKPRFVTKNQTAIVQITCSKPVCVETFQNYRPLARFLLRTNGITVAAGQVKTIL